MNEKYGVFTFETTQHALILEKALKINSLGVKLMPVPRELSSSCGSAAYVALDEKEAIMSLINELGLRYDNFYELEVKPKDSWLFKRFKK